MKNSIKIIGLLIALAVLAGSSNLTANALTLQERDAAAKAAYQKAKNQYAAEVNFYKTTRQQFLDAKDKYQKFKNSDNKAAYETQARAYLEKIIDVLIKKLETIKVWVSNRQTISETEKQNIISEIDSDISKLNQMKVGIDTATPDQIVAKAKEVRAYWDSHRSFVKMIVGQIWGARINFLITKAENLASKIDTKIQELKAAGTDTANLEAWLADFNQKIATAKEKKAAADVKFQAINSLASADQLFREGHQFILDADKYIREAHAALVKIVQEMKKVATKTSTPTPTVTTTATPTATPAQ